MKKSNIILTGFSLLLISVTSCNTGKESWELKSPDGLISVFINSSNDNADSQLSYEVTMLNNGINHKVLDSSPLGITREDGNFTIKLTFVKINVQENVPVEYQLLSGKQRQCRNKYNEMVLEFLNPEKQPVNLIFRAFDDGIAFCYEFPLEADKKVIITGENSGFNIPGATAWMHAYDTVTMYTPAYETYYEGPMISGTAAPSGKTGWAFPALFETAEKQWLLISESSLDGSYLASHLDVSGSDGLYTLRKPEQTEAMGFFDATSSVKLPFRTPWRVVITGNALSDIVESNLITDLAPENKLKDVSWIKPGRAGWSWWYDNNSPKDYKLMLPFIDFAAKMGWEYFLVDANWNMMKNGTMEDLAAYANKKGVGLLLWYNSGGKHNVVTEQPRDLMFDREVRRKEFQRIHELGVKGVKVDFFQSDKADIIRQYIDILEDAAEFQILVNFHGCTLPKGWSRTYPNLVSTEALRGAESYLFDAAYPEKAPAHLAIVPFTRGVVGPTDYTPGGFSDVKYPHLTSNGFEIALPVIIESGITHYVDAPLEYSKLPEFALEMLKEIPVLWDEIRFLDGSPGKYAVLARRSGEKWFVAGINSQNQEQTVKIDISPLTENGKLKIITDGNEKRSLVEKELVSEGGIIELKMMPLGGFVGIVGK